MHVRRHCRLSAALVLDMGTGLLRGVAVAPTDDEALNQALATAVNQPAAPLPPGPPPTVLSGPERGEAVAEALRQATDEPAPPTVAEG